MYKFAAIAIASFAVIAASSTSFAKDEVKVGGNLINSTTIQGNNTNIAGTQGYAVNAVGTIFEGVDVGANLNNTTYIGGDNTNQAGFRAYACNYVGAIGAPKHCGPESRRGRR